ncbi:Cystathionine gamma-lyase [Frankliniella fusca]|uniref:Cystathionine gamma-lyase n=1 Tax=Frankliniella fusca TaxID=407009 RepID=A0AAE1LLE1_9NEOP|nr:Cystathionine gamma-lyase [Frankliniella fusca]
MADEGASTSTSVSDVRALLHGWGIADLYIRALEAEDWTVRALEFMTNADIERIFTKPGPRQLFTSNLSNFKKDKTVNIASEESEIESDITFAPRTKKRRLDNANLALILNETALNEIHGALQKSLPGTIVLAHYKAHKVLDDYTRNILCSEVIQHKLKDDYSKALERADYNFLADQILELFPSESKATWYEEVKKKNHSVVQGRLRTKYYSIRKGLMNALLISKPNNTESAESELNFDDLGPDEEDVDFCWLLNNYDPWDTVVEKWELTILRRKKHLLSCERIYEFIQKFPCLKEPLGWKLLAADGIRSQPQLELSLRESWPEYSKFLLTIIRQTNKTFLKGRQYKSLSTEQEFVYVLLELPKLFKVRTLPKSKDAGRRETCWRASYAEITDGIALHVVEPAELQERIENRKRLLLKYKFQLQPMPVFVGPLNAIRQSFIVVDDQRWEVRNPFEAVEGTFQLMFGADAQYPADARHLWLFLQLTLFKIETPHDYSKDSGLHSHIAGTLTYIKHHSEHHSLKPFVCSCGRSYGPVNSFKKHALSCKENLSSYSQSLNNVLINEIPVPSDHEDVTRDVISIAQPDIINVHNEDIHSCSMVSEANIFVSKLYSKPKLPRSYVQNIIDDTTVFIKSGLLPKLRSSIMSCLDLNDEQVGNLNAIFSSVESPFSHLSSEYHRFKYFQSTGDFIAPISYEIGEVEVLLQKKKVYGQSVPLDLVLKKYLEIPNALNDIMSYVDSLKSLPETKENFIQSKLWKSKLQNYKEDDIVFPLNVYYDDCECNNPLGSSCKKIGCTYVQISCLPPECQSSVENIFLALVFETQYRNFSDDKAFKPLISQLRSLETNGIVLDLPDGPKRVYFVCGLLLGDNLGLNSVGGFAESFTANYFCRFCKTHKNVTHTQSIEDVSSLRTEQSFADDISTNNVSLTGIKGNCAFNLVPSFHISSNFCVDIFHDLAEGVAHYVMLHVLRHCIPEFFTVDLLNHRIELYRYGPCDSNRIPLVSKDFAAQKKLKMSGSEMIMFVRLFGFLIGDKVPGDDDYWQLYLKMCLLLDVCSSKAFSSSESDSLRVLVCEFNTMYVQITKDNLKPKFHNLVHYPRICEESGPPALTSTKRFESKHRDVLIPAQATESRRNVCLTVAIQHQINQSFRFLSKVSIVPPTEFGPVSEVDLSDFPNHDFVQSLPNGINLTFRSSCLAANWVQYKGTLYKPGMILLSSVDKSGGPVFGLLQTILVSNEIFCFVFSVLSCLGFDDHVHAYQVEASSRWSCCTPTDLLDPLPLSLRHNIFGKEYVSLRYKL